MARRLSQILQDTERRIQEHEKGTLRATQRIVRAVYQKKDGEYIDAFSDLVEAIDQANNSRTLRRRIGGLVSYLKRGEEYREKPEEQKNRMLVAKAAKILQDKDKEEGRKILTLSGYSQRIYAAAKRGQISLERVSSRIAYIEASDLEKIGTAAPTTKARRPNTGIDANSVPTFEAYTSLRNSGMSPEEIRTRYEDLVPKGKNPGKFFGALEGLYRRHRTKKK